MRDMVKALLIVLVLFGMYSYSLTLSVQFGSNMGYGAHTDSVRLLQKFLQSRDLYEGPITGNFLDATEDAVKQFQAKEGIETTGYFGPQSRAAANAYSASSTLVTPSFGVLAIGSVLILLIVSARRAGQRSSFATSYSGSDSSYSDRGNDPGSSNSWGGHPALQKGATSARGRADGFGNTWFSDDAGTTTRARVDDLGHTSFEDSSGNVMQEKEDWFGGSYFTDGSGNTMQSRTDDVGNTYYKDNHGNVIREREDDFGNKTYTRE